MQESNLIRLFQDLSNASSNVDRVNLLERIFIELSNVSSASEFEQIHQQVPWSNLFTLLRSINNDEVQRLLCSVLEHFINNFSVDLLMKNFFDLLNTGLESTTGLTERGKILCLKGLEKLSKYSNVESFAIIEKLFQHQHINALLHLFLDNDQQVLWLKSKEILEQMIRNISQINDEQLLNNYLVDQYFHGNNRALLLSSKDRNEIVRLRLYEYLIDLCLIDQRIYQHITEQQHLLDQFLHDCTHQADDILYLMNCLELLTSLTQKIHTLAYLQNKTNITNHFFRLLVSDDESGLIDLIKPALIKFFGSYLRNYLILLRTPTTHTTMDELLDKFLPFLFDILLQAESATYVPIGLDTIGFIGKNVPGKDYLLSNGKFPQFMDTLVLMIRSAQSDIRIRSLTCLTDLFYLSANDLSLSAGSSLTERIYQMCNRVHPILPIVINIAKQPFVDLRLAGFRCLLEMTKSPWGLTALNVEPGFIEFLLNRSTEKDKEGKEAKFFIIKSICSLGDDAKTIVGNVNFLKFRRYLNEGAFYVEPEANVAFDGSNE